MYTKQELAKKVIEQLGAIKPSTQQRLQMAKDAAEAKKEAAAALKILEEAGEWEREREREAKSEEAVAESVADPEEIAEAVAEIADIEAEKIAEAEEVVEAAEEAERELMRAMCRAVMRHPNQEALALAYQVHEKMNLAFAGMPDEAIEWLIGGSSKTSRGGFRPGDAQKFKAFFQTDPRSIAPQQLIQRLESTLTAMAYRAISADWGLHPHEPETIAQRQMHDLLQQMVRPYIVPEINRLYPDRAVDQITWDEEDQRRANNLLTTQGYVSEDSEAEDDESALPEDILSAYHFRRYRTIASPKQSGDPWKDAMAEESDDPCEDKADEAREQKSQEHTWMGAAARAGLPVGRHISGTAPLTLAAMAGVLHWSGPTAEAKQEAKSAAQPPDPRALEALGALLTIPTYLRANFHGPHETQAGNEYFFNIYHKRENLPLQPYVAAARGLDSLAQVADSKVTIPGQSMGLREAIEITGAELAAAMPKVDAYLPMPEVAESKAPPEFDSPQTLSEYLQKLPFDACHRFCASFQDAPPKCLTTAAEVEQSDDEAPLQPSTAARVELLLASLDSERRTAVYAGLRPHLANWVKSAADFAAIAKHLIAVQRVELYQQLKRLDRLPVPDCDSSLTEMLSYLPTKQCEDYVQLHQETIRALLASEAIHYVLGSLKLPAARAICLALGDELAEHIKSYDSFKTVLEVLSQAERLALYHRLGDKLANLIGAKSPLPDKVFEDLPVIEQRYPAVLKTIQAGVNALLAKKARLEYSIFDHKAISLIRLFLNADAMGINTLLDKPVRLNLLIQAVTQINPARCQELLALAQKSEVKESKSRSGYEGGDKRNDKATTLKQIMLVLAIQAGNDELVRKYSSDKDLLAVMSDKNLLRLVQQTNHPKIVALFENELRFLAIKKSWQTPSLHDAIEKHPLLLVKNLIVAGSDIHAVDNNGDTPLHKAVEAARYNPPREPIVRLLLNLGAKTDVRNKQGKTPLDLAEDDQRLLHIFALRSLVAKKPVERNLLVAKELSAAGFDIHKIDDNGDTMLHLAVKKFHSQNPHVEAAVRLLLKLGAKTDAPNYKGETPLDLAKDNPRLLHILVAHQPPKAAPESPIRQPAEGKAEAKIRPQLPRSKSKSDFFQPAVEAQEAQPSHSAPSLARRHSI